MTAKRFKHSEIIQDDGQIICYGIEDTQTRHIFNVPFIDDGLYEVSEKELIKLLNTLHEENQDLKKQMKRLYNYFEDFFSGEIGNNDFSGMWDFVAEDVKWD